MARAQETLCEYPAGKSSSLKPERVRRSPCEALQDGAQAAEGQVWHVHPGRRVHDRATARQHQSGTRGRHAPHHTQSLCKQHRAFDSNTRPQRLQSGVIGGRA